MAPISPRPGAPSRPPAFLSPTWVVDFVRSVLLDRRWFWPVAALLLLGEAALGLLIIRRVPYTKIDWVAYMQQVEGFLDGERDYSKLEGETGPLVYPALHLWIYTAFHELLPAHDRVRAAQYIFLGVYLSTFLIVASIYFLAGRRGRHVPQILLIPLTLSKRAHSVYLLRLFNDPLAMLLLYSSVVALMLGGRAGWRIGAVLWSLALGVKMNILLFLPGLLVLAAQNRGLFGSIEMATLIASVQLAIPLPFLRHDPLAYFNSAFDFSRQFLYEWTVNWRFVPEADFLSKRFARVLLFLHLDTLIPFAYWRWSVVSPLTILQRALSSPATPTVPPADLPSHHIPLVLFTSNLIGMTFARTLHYQFHVWYFHEVPLLLWYGGAWGSPVLGASLWGLIEYAWATAPSTNASSGVLLVAHIIMLLGLWSRAPTAAAVARASELPAKPARPELPEKSAVPR